MPVSSDDQPSAFELLEEGLQRQLYAMRWRELRPIQSKAIKAHVLTKSDLLIMAETAGGKTEAAFLPVLSAIASETEGSVRAVYIGPLKALINDQFGRLEDLCAHLDVKVHRWHGDVADTRKSGLLRNPGGVLLITPESLESLLINRTSDLPAMFGGLRAVVIDELHAFLEGERGLHLASLLARLARYVSPTQPPARMLGLSATIGDPAAAQRFLRPDAPDQVMIIGDDAGGKEIQFRIHGYVTPPDESAGRPGGANDRSQIDEARLRVMQQVAADLVDHCRTHANLVFANAKGDIELYADMANERCRAAGLPETFLVHHGSLAKEVREDAETMMKSGTAMTTVCSSTLEMGIDIGSVRMVGQIGAPWSVASFKQRLGRSGRKDGEPRRLRGYVICDSHGAADDPLSAMPLDLLQSAAICELMLCKWVEPPAPDKFDLSTLAHQVMSTIAEMGAADAAELHARLCRQGPFRALDPPMFARVLRELGAGDVIEQGPDGKLILGLIGERLRARKDFYAAFASPLECTLVADDRALGVIPIDAVPKLGEHLVFAAKRWQVVNVDAARLRIDVKPARRRGRARFSGGLGEVHPRVREEMQRLLGEETIPAYLDPTAAETLRQARSSAKEHGLARRGILALGGQRCLWLTWTGTKMQRTLKALVEVMGVDVVDREVGLECDASPAMLRDLLASASRTPPTPLALASTIAPKAVRKYDHLFSDELLDVAIATDRLSPLQPDDLAV